MTSLNPVVEDQDFATSSGHSPDWAWVVFVIVCVGIAEAISVMEIVKPIQLGLSIYPHDIVSVAMAVIVGIWWFRGDRLMGEERILLLILALSIAEFIRGTLQFGTAAGVAFRQDFTTLVLVIFLARARLEVRGPQVVILLLIVAMSYAAVYFLRFFGVVGLSSFTLTYNASTSFRYVRYVPADGGMSFAFVALAGPCLYSLYRTGMSRFCLLLVAAAMAVLTFVAYHRSVWVATALAMLVFLWAGTRHRTVPGGAAIAFLLVSTAIYAFWVAAVFGGANIDQAIESIFNPEGTAAWRIYGWGEIIANMSVTEWLTGVGYGVDSVRIVFGQEVNASAHNLFVGQFNKLGIFGLVLYLMLFWRLMSNLLRVLRDPVDEDEKYTTFFLVVLTTCVLGYYFAYSHWIPDAVVVGCGLSFLRASRARRAGIEAEDYSLPQASHRPIPFA